MARISLRGDFTIVGEIFSEDEDELSYANFVYGITLEDSAITIESHNSYSDHPEKVNIELFVSNRKLILRKRIMKLASIDDKPVVTDEVIFDATVK